MYLCNEGEQKQLWEDGGAYERPRMPLTSHLFRCMGSLCELTPIKLSQMNNLRGVNAYIQQKLILNDIQSLFSVLACPRKI